MIWSGWRELFRRLVLLRLERTPRRRSALLVQVVRPDGALHDTVLGTIAEVPGLRIRLRVRLLGAHDGLVVVAEPIVRVVVADDVVIGAVHAVLVGLFGHGSAPPFCAQNSI